MTRHLRLYRLTRLARAACRWRPPLGIRRLVVLEPELGSVMVRLILMVYGEPVTKRLVQVVDGGRELPGWRERLEEAADAMYARVVAEAKAEGELYIGEIGFRLPGAGNDGRE
jgi:hypothetical protein